MGPGAARPLRTQPLWVRVDENRTRLVVFVAAFVAGSAALLDTALVLVPGSLLSLAFAEDPEAWFRGLGIVAGIAFGVLLAIGALLAAVQLSNAEDWVRNRFSGTPAKPGEHPGLESAMHDMSLAAGLAAAPRLIIMDSDAINAFALGTTRTDPTIGVTRGFLAALSDDEQRAVMAALTARIVAGDIMFGTALAALMGPLKAIRESGGKAAVASEGCADGGCTGPGCSDGCVDPGCSGCGDLDLGDSDGCAGIIGLALFLALVAFITYLAVISAAWIVTIWGRVLHRTVYEKADAEGMLLLKDPSPMLSALRKSIDASNEVAAGDGSYDGIFYAALSGKPGVDRRERRRYERLQEVLGAEGGTVARV